MNMQNGTHSKKKRGFGGWVKDTFIFSKDDSRQARTGKVISIIALVLIVSAIVMGGMIIGRYVGAHNSTGDAGSLLGSSETPPASEIISSQDNVSSTEDVFDPETGVLSKLSDLYKENKEIMGWIEVPGTKLNSPVTQGKDNAYYLSHNWQKKSNPFGTPFIDYRATLATTYQSNILTLHGHNSKAGEFFESVKNYSDIEYYKAHPIVNFDTIYGSGQYKIIGRFTLYTPVDGEFWRYHDAIDLDEANFNIYLKELDKVNYYNSGVDVKFGDNLLVLSTCNDAIQGPKNTPYRDVLVARKIRPGESAKFDVSKIEKNTDMVMPEGWVKKYGKENPYK